MTVIDSTFDRICDDLRAERAESRAERAEFRAEMRAWRAETKADIAALGERISGLEDRLGGLEERVSQVDERLGRIGFRAAGILATGLIALVATSSSEVGRVAGCATFPEYHGTR